MSKCICKGNWREIVKECEPLIDQKYIDSNGDQYAFFGVVHGGDDFYYGMFGGGKLKLLSCVGSIEGHGYKLIAPCPHSQLHG